MAKACDKKCKPEAEENFALQLLKDYSKQAHRWFIIALVILGMWLATIGGFIWYLNQYDFSGYDYDLSTEGGGNANFIGNDGDIINGAN